MLTMLKTAYTTVPTSDSNFLSSQVHLIVSNSKPSSAPLVHLHTYTGEIWQWRCQCWHKCVETTNDHKATARTESTLVCWPAPASLVTMVKWQGWPAMPWLRPGPNAVTWPAFILSAGAASAGWDIWGLIKSPACAIISSLYNTVHSTDQHPTAYYVTAVESGSREVAQSVRVAHGLSFPQGIPDASYSFVWS